jgi:hypothetical protein
MAAGQIWLCNAFAPRRMRLPPLYLTFGCIRTRSGERRFTPGGFFRQYRNQMGLRRFVIWGDGL